ncbi:helix-turn-helix domain-containing protein [Cohnella herbarum]|uniref:Helix-turn-helix domain-containing protein n=1 Tax=Cohnella herbarum TaxID=2728023 RepID=A0A7Z2VNL6_9BACL|nr:helix-turn-helix domain-containing protein [Cohnella herbarum]QJD86296.1 helix-turn-helix domain-containing protein [Cohnella herbarum]
MDSKQLLDISNTLIEIGEVSYSFEADGWRLESQTMTKLTFLYFEKIQGTFVLNGIPIQLNRKSSFMLEPGMTVEARSVSGHETKLYMITFDMYRLSEKSASRRVFDQVDSFPITGSIQQDQYRIQRLVLMIAEEFNEENNGLISDQSGKNRACLHMYELLELLLGSTPAVLPGGEKRAILMTIPYMHRAYDSDLTLERLAELAGMHPSYYSQMFKQEMNRSPITFLTEIRMNRAKEELLMTGRKMSEVAKRVGYQDSFYFSRRFKEYTGCAPTLYREQPKPNVISLSYAYTDHLLTLGITPVAAQTYKEIPKTTRMLALPFHGSEVWQVSRQTFLEAKADLVIGKDNVSATARELIGDLAPIITIPWGTLTVFEHLREVARIVQRTEEAKEWIARHERTTEAARRRVQAAIGQATVTLCVIGHYGMRIYGNRNIGHVFYQSLGLLPPNRLLQDMEEHTGAKLFNWKAIEIEQLTEYDSDYLFVAVRSDGNEQQYLHRLQTSEAYVRHSAVRRNRVHFLDWEKWIVYAPMSIESQLDEAVDYYTDVH